MVTPVCIMDISGRVQEYNKAWCDFVGKPEHEIANRPCWELLHGTSEPVPDCPLVKMRETGRSEVSTLPIGDKWFEIAAHPIARADGTICACVHTMLDVTARRQAEAREEQLRNELERRKREEALAGLAGGVAHELNNSLNPLVGLPELIAENLVDMLPPGPRSAQILSQLDDLSRSARRTASVVRSLVARHIPPQPVEASPAPGAASISANGKQILVVDDEPLQRRLACTLLEDLGYRTQAATSGEEAVQILRVAAAREEPSPFDLVLLDMIMDGMDGVTTHREITSVYPEQRCMVVSGHTPSRRAKALATLGCLCLTKPYTQETLHEAVLSALNGHAAAT